VVCIRGAGSLELGRLASSVHRGVRWAAVVTVESSAFRTRRRFAGRASAQYVVTHSGCAQAGRRQVCAHAASPGFAQAGGRRLDSRTARATQLVPGNRAYHAERVEQVDAAHERPLGSTTKRPRSRSKRSFSRLE
jgi:hypothetical protein